MADGQEVAPRRKWYRYDRFETSVLIGGVLVIAGSLFGGWYYVAANTTTTEYTNCEVTSTVPTEVVVGRMAKEALRVESSCGVFRIERAFSNTVTPEDIVSFKTTNGPGGSKLAEVLSVERAERE